MLLNASNKPLEVNRSESKQDQIDTLDKNFAALWNRIDYLSNPHTSPLLSKHPVSNLQHDRLVHSNNKGDVSSVTNLGDWIRGTRHEIVVKNTNDGRVKLSLSHNMTVVGGLTVPNLTVTSLTPNRLVASNAANALVSVGNLTAWVAGTANQVNVANDGDGTITLSTPQDIHAGAIPTFAGATFTGNVAIENASELRLYNAADIFYTGFEAPALAGNQIYVLPLVDGAANTFLQTNGAGTLIWAAVAPGGANTNVQYNNAGAFGGDAGFVYDGAGTATVSVAYDTTTGAGVYQINSNTVLAIPGTDNLQIGVGADVNTSTNCTYIGKDVAGAGNSTGTHNLAVGEGSLFDVTSSSYTTALGYRTLFSCQTDVGNFAAGAYALYTNNGGRYNFACGYQSMFFNVTGDYNLALGYWSLRQGVAAAQCIAIGQNSLFNTNSSSCIGIGTSSAYTNTSGNGLIAIGVNSLYFNSTGHYCIAIGGNSLYSNVGGDYNIGIGSQTANNQQAGDYSINIGRHSGYGFGAFFSASYNTHIGSFSAYNTTTNIDRCIILGAYSGYYNRTANRLIIDSIQRANAATEVTSSIIHGDINAAPASQALRLNADVLIRYHTTQGPGTKCDGLVTRAPAEIQTLNAVQTTADSITLLDENTYHCIAYVVGVKSDGTDRASYHVECTVYRTGGGGATLQGAVTVVHSQESNAAWDATFTVNGNDLRVSVTGVAATTIEWTANLKYINMSN